MNWTPQRIKDLRGRLKVSQEELAALAGCSFTTINRWENGRTKPSRLAAARLDEIERRMPQTEDGTVRIPVRGRAPEPEERIVAGLRFDMHSYPLTPEGGLIVGGRRQPRMPRAVARHLRRRQRADEGGAR